MMVILDVEPHRSGGELVPGISFPSDEHPNYNVRGKGRLSER